MHVTLRDTLKVTVNSISEGLIDKSAAIEMLENAVQKNCIDCREKAINDLTVCLMTLENAIVEESKVSIIDLNSEYPLDSMLLKDAVILNEHKKMILHCEDGHVLGMYRVPLELKTNIMGVGFYGEGKRVACI